ncbi:glycosyltransferase family 2 protein [Paenibacillus sp.]|uniref:glycosyltransferase family 2 protein n=1 Tax=Paenibacillus sp. TaxID=58172 RepID=UPI002D229F95|nr:glycosyltransferase family 2 protein [Paenibacillus sp.]HZG57969.1 glycosyltransferase family 2 protein [Paenibacillus sp.]
MSSGTKAKHAAVAGLLADRRWKEAEARSVELLRSNRLDAQAWVSLAEALLHQGYGAAARRCFRRAWLLDPQAYWADDLERMAAKAHAGDERYDIEGLLRVPQATVSAVIVAKNEEATIGKCLESLQGAVDRILFFDNGSTDGTLAIASAFPNVEIRHLEWNGGFGALRNEALAFVETDWVLWLDADEWLHEDDAEAVKEAAGCYQTLGRPVVLNVWHLNYVDGQVNHDISQGRMFTARYGLRYYGRIHEQVGTADGGIFDSLPYRSAVRIRYHHVGYEPIVVQSKAKIERNRNLLLRMVAEEPENPGWWYFLGRETLAANRFEEGYDALRRAEALAAAQPGFGRMVDVYKLMLYATDRLGDAAETDRVYEAMRRHDPEHPDVLLLWAERERREAQRLLERASRHLASAKRGFETYRGIAHADRSIWRWRADAAEAEIAMHAGKLAEAKDAFDRARRAGMPKRAGGQGDRLADQVAKLLRPERPPERARERTGGERDGT